MSLLSAAFTFSWRNLTANKARSAAASAGIAFALFLVFLQWGFLDAAKKQVTTVFDFFDYDIAILKNTYQFLFTTEPFDRVRLIQAKALPEVEKIFAVNFSLATWEDDISGLRSSLMLFGVDPDPDFVADRHIGRGLQHLRGKRDVIVDAYSHPDFGPLAKGTRAFINNQEVRIAGHFLLGMFFYTEGSALVDNNGFSLLTGRSSRQTSFGFIQLNSGASPDQTRARLQHLLPDDVIAITKTDLIAKEQEYFIEVKPLGFIFSAGVVISFLTAFVILFQVVATDINTRVREYATLKAMGFGFGFIYGTALLQVFLIAAVALLAATLQAALLFHYVEQQIHLPLAMTGELLGIVSGVSLAMVVITGFASLFDLAKANPADLY
ncbi:FtsX-like permease family protein [Thiorhodovibrio winogradskyi]|nr:FtsX-like permease family protein [Thiorhodovibrio winogradskyi]